MANYKTMNKTELRTLAQERNVEVDEDATNKEIVEALEKADAEQGTDAPDDAETFTDGEPEAPESVVTSEDVSPEQPDGAPVVAGDEADDSNEDTSEPTDKSEDDGKVVVKMISNTASYSVANMKFTKTHPFHTVSEDLCEYLVSTGNFEKASSDEVAEYYK